MATSIRQSKGVCNYLRGRHRGDSSMRKLTISAARRGSVPAAQCRKYLLARRSVTRCHMALMWRSVARPMATGDPTASNHRGFRRYFSCQCARPPMNSGIGRPSLCPLTLLLLPSRASTSYRSRHTKVCNAPRDSVGKVRCMSRHRRLPPEFLSPFGRLILPPRFVPRRVH